MPNQDNESILKYEIKSKSNYKTINNNITNQLLQRRHGTTGHNIINITNIGNESINDLTKNEIKNIVNSNLNGLTILMNNIYFNSRLLNKKYINVIEDNKIVKKNIINSMGIL